VHGALLHGLVDLRGYTPAVASRVSEIPDPPRPRTGITLAKGSLWDAVVERTREARRNGHLHSVESIVHRIDDAGVRFVVRRIVGLDRKRAPGEKRPENPFLPYDEELFVADVSATHLCVLNKYNVLDHHLLLVTRAFEPQEGLLDVADFTALWACLLEYDALVFYNAGRIAGASQAHRHLQLVPTPLAEGFARTPMDGLLGEARFDDAVGTAGALPFHHALARLRSCRNRTPDEAGRILAALYAEMTRAFGCDRPGRPYNLLVTRDWMLFVPRARETWRDVPVNGLGFAGSLVARTDAQLATLRHEGPLRVLRGVAVEKPAGASRPSDPAGARS
jgi:ATP adenylyltransferase